MRPIANFTLHAIAAATLAAFAATSAAAQSDTYLALGDSIPNASGRDRGQHIDVLSYSFGVSETRAKGGNVEYQWKVEEGESAPPPPTGGVRVASGDVDGDSQAAKKPRTTTKMLVPGATRPTSGATSGRVAGIASDPSDPAAAKHKDFTVTKSLDAATPKLAKPLDRGSVWVRLASPWAACRVGARYPSLVLASGAERHRLEDVTVSSCGAGASDGPEESITFVYGKLGAK